MDFKNISIAICLNENNWHLKFVDALEAISLEHEIPDYELVDINTDDWITKLDDFDAVIWKPNHMGFESASYFKEKIYFIEKHLGKLVVPNFNSVWHFESKVAQKYIFEKYKIRTPRTIATFDYHDALNRLNEFQFPIVMKKSTGAAASNVKLVATIEEARSLIDRIYCKEVVSQDVKAKGRILGKLSKHYLHLRHDWNTNSANQPVVYWQEFIPDNSRDLRITVIGNKYAFGFWRNNRPNDFRASGSGNIDFVSDVPETAIKYCMNISDMLDLDSMAYDLLFTGDEIKVVEMSYGYLDTAIYKSNGYYELVDSELLFHKGNYWPQELWVRWAMCKVSKL